MANTKISDLPAVTLPVAGTVQVPVVQAGATKVATVADLRDTPEPFTMTAQATGSVSASSPNTIRMFARSYAGRVMPEFVGPNGVDCFVQPALFNNSVVLWSPSSSTTGGAVIASAFTATGTISHPIQGAIGTNSMQDALRRTRFQTTGTTAGSSAGIRGAISHVWRGNAANLGGFFAFFRFSQQLNATAAQSFVGLYAGNGALADEPSTWMNMIGIGYNSTDAIGTGWRLMMNDATGTATSVTLTGAPRDTTTVLDLTIFCPPNSSGITARVYNQTTQTVVLDNVTYTTDIPVADSFLTYHAQCRNTTGAAGVTNVELARIYLESDI